MKVKIFLCLILFFIGIESSFPQVQQEWVSNRQPGIAGRFIVYDTSGFIFTSSSVVLMDSPPVTEIVKYTAYGTLLWSKTCYGENRGLSIDSSHNSYIASYTYFSWGAPKQMNLIKYDTSGTEVWRVNDTLFMYPDALVSMKGDYAGNSYMFMYRSSLFELSKYNSSGTLIWVKSFSGPGNDNIPAALEIDRLGNAIIIGESVNGSSSSFYLVKYNPSGTLQWAHQYTPTGPLRGYSVNIASDISCNIFAALVLRDTTYVSHLVTIKYNPAGVQQWMRTYSQSVASEPVFTETDILGNVISAIPYTGIIKYDSTGVFQWNINTNVSAISVDKNLNLYFTRSPNYNSYTLLKYSSSGAYQWETSYSPGSNCNYLAIAGIVLDTAFNIYITGGYQYLSYPLFWNPASITAKYNQLVGISNPSSEVPSEYKLYQNYPNPFNPTTKIKFSIPPSKGARGMTVRLSIYDILGKEVAVLVNQQMQPGSYNVEWNAVDHPSGVYFYRITVGNASAPLSTSYTETKKMIFLK
jgi:hypothetical protein